MVGLFLRYGCRVGVVAGWSERSLAKALITLNYYGLQAGCYVSPPFWYSL